MIIARTPLRLSLAGGGTDLPAWQREHGSLFISGAIDKYIYTTVHASKFNPNIRLRYSTMEEVSSVSEVKHDILRETLKVCGIDGGIELTSHAEIPSGTGLGSSGSFGVGALQALIALTGGTATKEGLAHTATTIQRDILGYPIGPQDQYVAAYGGIALYQFDKDGSSTVSHFHPSIGEKLEKRLVLFYTGIKRDTNDVLRGSSTDGLDRLQELASTAARKFSSGDIDWYGQMLNEHWREKKKRGGMTNEQIDGWYDQGLKAGAMGGKLVGAGGGGFLLFYTNDRERLIQSLPLLNIPFHFDEGGSTILND